MGSHHINSRKSYEKCKVNDNFKRIIHRIAKFYEDRPEQTFTDRNIKEKMYSVGLLPENDMNMVRPKINQLIENNFLREVGSTEDKKTNRTVRLTRWNDRPDYERELY